MPWRDHSAAAAPRIPWPARAEARREGLPARPMRRGDRRQPGGTVLAMAGIAATFAYQASSFGWPGRQGSCG
jgi:hypothetical protein